MMASSPSPSAHAVSQYTATSTNLSKRLAIHAWNTHSEGWFSWTRARLPNSGHILEVGAGTGDLWSQPDHSNHGLDLVLTDFSPAMCEQLRAAVPLAEVRQCDACSLPFEDGFFDAVVANHMLYHVDDPEMALAEFARVLKPTGKVFIALNGMDHLDELFQIGEIINRTSTIRKVAKVTAENAVAYLEKHFRAVKSERFPGIFEVSDGQAVVQYLESVGDSPMTEEETGKVRRVVEERMKRDGRLRITKNMVLFSGVPLG